MSGRRAPLLAVLVPAFCVLAAGCSDEGAPREWLRAVCGSDATIAAPPADEDYSDYRADDVLTCTLPDRPDDSYDEVDATAFVTDTDPRQALLSAVDGWESGDGVEFRYATNRIASGSWGVVMSVSPTEEVVEGLDGLAGFTAYGSREVFDRG